MSLDCNNFIKVENLCLKTPEGVVFDHVNFEVGEGEVCSLFGSAGTGKTALLLTLGARMKFSKGKATVATFDLKHNRRSVRNATGITVVHKINDVLEHLSVKDILSSDLYLSGKKGNSKNVDAYLKSWNFEDQENTQYFSLTAEEKIYFSVMLACTNDPKVLLVDDIQESVTQHASFKMIDIFHSLANKRKITTIFSTNEYELAQQADSIVIMSQTAKLQREAVLQKCENSKQPKVAGWANHTEDNVDRHPNKSSIFKDQNE